jgi:acetate kinase
MQDLLRQEGGNPDAALAVALFCYQAAKFVGALAAALGGLDELIFTGGIGEHAAPVRARICERLQFLGIELDAARNSANASVISIEGGIIAVRVIKTNEELMMARHAERLLHECVAK